ncbi:hypothetical protein Tco_0437795 [Tanacetum coccineum]
MVSSFAKRGRRAPSPVCIVDNHSCMKHRKSGFFLIDRRAILDSMVWRHPNAAIDDPRPAAGSFSMADVHQLSAYVIKLRDMPKVMGIHDFLCLPEWTGAEVREEPHLDVSSTLQRLPFYCTPPANVDAIIPDPTLKDLAIGTSSSKILAKVEASQKRKPSTFGATLSHAVIPSLGNQGRNSTAPIAKGSNTRDSRGKGIMADDAAAPSVGASRERPSFRPAPSFRDVSADSRLKAYKERVADVAGLELQMSTLKKQVSGLNDKLVSSDASFAKSKAKEKKRKKKIKSLTKSLDNLHAEVDRLSATLNQATVLEAEKNEEILSLKATPPEFASFFRGHVGFERGLSMHRTKDEFAIVLKKMANFMHDAHDRLTEASLLVARTDYAFLDKISEHATKPLSVILQLEPEKLDRPANFPPSRDTRVSTLSIKESTVTPASKSLELSANVDLTASAVTSEHNEEMLNAEVDGSDPKMIDDTLAAKSGHAFMQGISVALEDVVELAEVGSGRASSGPNDVVVALPLVRKVMV